jgi:hypothetical protein
VLGLAKKDQAVLGVLYDLRDPDSLEQAKRHRRTWGLLYTEATLLDEDHVALTFRSAGPLWSAWEAVRLGWILDDLDQDSLKERDAA